MRSKDVTDLGITINSLCLELNWSNDKLYSRMWRGFNEKEQIRLDEAILKLKKEVEDNAAHTYFKKLQRQSILFKKIDKRNRFQTLKKWGFSIKEQIDIIYG